ncbi:hypothetical protein [Nocardia brevicatena]|uniref:hypothetical protein n=1 Tax=Nocardia brevicatena TaxID=37327 RepID=UPI00068813FB|nr:hypothetical protein [Nocardia brevicatena]
METVAEPEQGIQPQLSGMMQHWQNLRNQAENGALRMDKELGDALKAQVSGLVAKLNSMLDDAERLKYVTGFGGLGSARDLQQKFANKAMSDEDSAMNRLKQAIDIATMMEETYSLAVRQLEESDQSVAAALGNAGV